MKKVKWQPWPYLLDLIDILCTYQEIDIDKARQLGVTWTVDAYGYWKANFNDYMRGLYLSQGEVEAWELISKTKFIRDHLPKYMQQDLETSSRGWITFKDSYSQIRALPSTEKAGSGYNATLVIRDELYNHPAGEANFAAIAPSIDAGGQIVNMSAVYGEDMTNHFIDRISQIFYNTDTVKKTYPSGLELYTNPKFPSRALVFLGWKLRPVRLEGLTLEEFYETRLKTRYTQRQLDRQYPERIEDTLKVSLTSSYFEFSALEDMGYQLSPPIKQSEVDTFNNIVRVYKLPIQGRQYVGYTDPSDGVEDPFVTGVMDYITGEVVASATGKVKVDFCAKIHNYLVRTYCNATNSYEYNAVGMRFAKCLEDFQTPNQAPRRKPDGKADLERKGQFMSREFKNMMLADLAFAIAKRQLVIHDREFIQQAKMVTRDDDGFPVTDKKLTFDWVMMMGGLNLLSKFAPRGKYRAYTIDV